MLKRTITNSFTIYLTLFPYIAAAEKLIYWTWLLHISTLVTFRICVSASLSIPVYLSSSSSFPYHFFSLFVSLSLTTWLHSSFAFHIYVLDLFAQYWNSRVFTFFKFRNTFICICICIVRIVIFCERCCSSSFLHHIFHSAPIYAEYVSVVMMLFIICLHISLTVNTLILV